MGSSSIRSITITDPFSHYFFTCWDTHCFSEAATTTMSTSTTVTSSSPDHHHHHHAVDTTAVAGEHGDAPYVVAPSEHSALCKPLWHGRPLAPSRTMERARAAPEETAAHPGGWSSHRVAATLGSAVAVLSQHLLTFLCQGPTIHTTANRSYEATAAATLRQVVWFSFFWSFGTCLLVFGTMLLGGTVLRGGWPHNHQLRRASKDAHSIPKPNPPEDQEDRNGTTQEDRLDDEDDDVTFQWEANYVVGAVLSIAALWLWNGMVVTEFLGPRRFPEDDHPRSSSSVWLGPALQSSVAIVITVPLVLTGLLQCWCHSCARHHHVRDNNNNTSNQVLLSTYSLVAGTLGGIMGVFSQLVLSLFLWQDAGMLVPVVASVGWFSLLWSLLTVSLTALGCLTLPWMVRDDVHVQQLEQQRSSIVWNMEMVYVGWNLVGIGLAWIWIDCTNGMTDQVWPSLGLLAASLVVFQLILKCCISPTTVSDEMDDAEQDDCHLECSIQLHIV